MTSWKVMTGTMALAAVLAAPGMSVAFSGGEHGPRHHKYQMFERMAEKLELTEGQKAQLKANRDASRESRMAGRKEMHELRDQLREAIDSGADQAALDQLSMELGRLEVARMQQRQQMQAQFESILTDEQKIKLEQMKSERKERWQKRRAERQQQTQ